jgi:hypothetical protein
MRNFNHQIRIPFLASLQTCSNRVSYYDIYKCMARHIQERSNGVSAAYCLLVGNANIYHDQLVK